jgi:hypothetical protein
VVFRSIRHWVNGSTLNNKNLNLRVESGQLQRCSRKVVCILQFGLQNAVYSFGTVAIQNGGIDNDAEGREISSSIKKQCRRERKKLVHSHRRGSRGEQPITNCRGYQETKESYRDRTRRGPWAQYAMNRPEHQESPWSHRS